MTIETRRERGGLTLLPDAIHWHEGMLLSPQHFQQAALRNEALAHYHTAAASPFHWGLMYLERGPFGEGVVSVRCIEAVLPDGLVVSWRGDNETELRYLLKDHVNDVKAGKNIVYLAVATHDARKGFEQRFELSTEKVPDGTTGRDDLDVQIMTPRLQLKLDHEPPAGFSSFPLAKVRWINGVIEEDKSFEPPWLRVRHGSRIYGLCDDIAERMRGAAETLASRIGDTSGIAPGPQALNTGMTVHAFMANLPPFEVLLRSGVAHPFPLYLGLAAILGSLCTGSVPDRLPDYDHDNVLPAFETVCRSIGKIVTRAAEERYNKTAFSRKDDERVFTLDFKEEWIGRKGDEVVLGVRIPEGRTQEQVHEWVMGSAIGARSRIDQLRINRVTGVGRRRLLSHELMPMPGVIFYSIDTSDRMLPVAKDDVLVVTKWGEGHESQPTEIVLYAKS